MSEGLRGMTEWTAEHVQNAQLDSKLEHPVG